MAEPPVLLLAVFLIALSCAAQTPRRYTSPGASSFAPRQTFRSVGVFGSFGIDTEVRTRPDVGLLTFTVWKDPSGLRLKWTAFADGKDLELGQSVLEGRTLSENQVFLDWCTARLDTTTGAADHPLKTETYLSRCMPALLVVTEGAEWTWKAGDIRPDAACFKTIDGKTKLLDLRDGRVRLAGSDLGAPWLLLWNRGLNGEQTVPLLLRFERKPSSIELGAQGVGVRFTGPAGTIAAMPLLGIRRPTKEWGAEPPAEAIRQADFWARATAAFPVANEESFKVDETRGSVAVVNRFKYREIKDDWGTKPLRLSPAPPVVGQAAAAGYPVRWAQNDVEQGDLATFLGPYAFRLGDQIEYEIPIPSARDFMLAPISTRNDPNLEHLQERLRELVASHPYRSPDFADGGLNLSAKEYAQAFRLLDDAGRRSVKADLLKALKDAYAPENLQTVVDPVTGQNYVMCDKIWCAKEPYDREWYAGRQLDATAEIARWVDAEGFRPYWKEIQGLYAYFRIYSDWSWCGVYSSVFGYNECADGMNFAMEGILGMAEMARCMGDDALWKDATYRAARQALSTVASYSMPEWLKRVDFATMTDTSFDYEAKKGRYRQVRLKPDQVITGFGMDIYSDSNGVKVLRPGSFWHACAAIYWNNPALYRLQTEFASDRIRKWRYETMPALHPGWLDTRQIEVYENKPYGNNHSLALLEAGAILFGGDPKTLMEQIDGLSPDVPVLYRIRGLQSAIQAGIPQAWVPAGDAELLSCIWDGAARKLTVTLRAGRDGRLAIDWAWRRLSEPGSGPKPALVRWNGKNARPAEVRGGFQRVEGLAKKGETVRLEVAYPE